jgi:hypothetical protein
MAVSHIPAEHLVALYDHNKNRRIEYQQEAYRILGGKCSLCGSSNILRHRFIDPLHPLANRYRTNPVTLFRRICMDLDLRNDLRLICRECRLALHRTNPKNAGDVTPNQKSLDKTTMEGKTNGR